MWQMQKNVEGGKHAAVIKSLQKWRERERKIPVNETGVQNGLRMLKDG